MLPQTPNVVVQLVLVTLIITFEVFKAVDSKFAVSWVIVKSEGSINHIPPLPALILDSRLIV